MNNLSDNYLQMTACNCTGCPIRNGLSLHTIHPIHMEHPVIVNHENFAYRPLSVVVAKSRFKNDILRTFSIVFIFLSTANARSLKFAKKT